MRPLTVILLVLTLLAFSPARGTEQSLAELEQQALHDATASVANSVVQIRTVGGLDRVGKTLLSQGPTTGLIVSADGYIVSSAFNFAGHPSSILVRLADGKQRAAKLIARDKNRMLVLLKVNTELPLPVPKPVAHETMRVGQWAVALGRTFQAEEVGVSVGIVSAIHRKYGRVIQTDASVSVANYGGPLVDISGRVLGVLVPMSPQAASGGAESEVAGAEYYDSGIGFAVPLDHVLGILERWKQGEDLLPGKLGIGLASGDAHMTSPKIVSVWPESPAAIAGWKANDLITAVNGRAVSTQAQLRFQIIPLYAGDTVRVTLRREEEDIQSKVTLAGKLALYRHAFLGVLPVRNPEKDLPKGAATRTIWSNSPASESGLEAGDRITKINDVEIKTTLEARSTLAGLHPGQTAEIVVARGEEELTFTVELSTVPEEIMLAANLPARVQPGSIQPKLNEHGEDAKLEKLTLPEFSQEAVYFSPAADKDQALGLLLWLGDGKAEKNQSLVDAWQAICRRDGILLLIAPPQKESVWQADDLSYLQQLARAASRRFNIDRHRMVVAGQGKAGQLAYALALKSKSAFAGVISIDAPLPRTLKPRDVSPNNRLALLAIESQNSNFAPLIRRDIEQLREAGYPTTWLQRRSTSDVTKEIDAATRASIARWIDGLDRY
ncbi:MAG: PDZ domain-containing protein [Planctomycetes bacterium]|nr:PDZ domain-containing protein [Planctomycetota bacterium]